MAVFLRHPETGGLMEAVDIGGDNGEAQAKHYESRGWVRIDEEEAEAAQERLADLAAGALSETPAEFTETPAVVDPDDDDFNEI